MLDANRSIVRGLAAGDFAVGHPAHVVAAIRGQIGFGRHTLVMMTGNGAVSGRAAAHHAGKPYGAREWCFEQQDGEQAEQCPPFARPLAFWPAHPVDPP